MKASDVAVFAFVTFFSCACAEGYGAPEIGLLDNAALTPSAAGTMSDAPLGGSAAAMSTGGTGGTGGVVPPAGEPCTQDDVKLCPCEGTEAQGQRICRYDMASPQEGFFAECAGCPPPTPPDPDPATLCSDGMQNGAETDIDCGGPDCMPCPAPSGGTGGASGVGGSGGSGGASGASGTSGEGGSAGEEEEPDPEQPVEDCEGVPEGTECNRDCILPSNTARCNSRGDCSCLG